MLIGLIGSIGSGKQTMVAELIRSYNFRRITIQETINSKEKGSQQEVILRSSQEALDFSTANWTLDFITTDLRTKSDIVPFLKRPWFILVLLQARLLDRWARIQSKLDQTFERFVIQDDLDEFGITRTDEQSEKIEESVDAITEINQKLSYQMKISSERNKSSLRSLMSFVSHSITNDLPLSEFLDSIGSIHLPIIRKSVRPSWDTYFTSLANLASLRSNCMKRRVGAVLVTQDNRIISTGYNGTPRGMINCNQGGCSRCNGKDFSPNQLTNTNLVASCGVNLEECLCLHAEENALLEAGRDRISNSRLYCNTCPCLRCTIKIVQCGVKEVIYSQSYSMDQQATKIFLEAGVQLRQFD